MKTLLRVLGFLLLALPGLAPGASYQGAADDRGDFYSLADGTKVPILRAREEIAVRFKAPILPEAIVDQVKTFLGDDTVAFVASSAPSGPARFDVLRVKAADAAVATLAARPEIAYATPVFLTPAGGVRLFPADEIIVGFDDAVTTLDELRAAAGRDGLEFTAKLPRMNACVFRLLEPTWEKVFAAAGMAARLPGVLYAEPNFLQEIRFEPEPAAALTLVSDQVLVTAGEPEPAPPAPIVQVFTRNATTAKTFLLITGVTVGPVTSVSYRVGTAGAFKTVAGKSAWRFVARLRPGKNVIGVVAAGPGGTSPERKIIVIRK